MCCWPLLSQAKFNLPVAAVLADDSVPSDAENALTTKLMSILTKNGFMASEGVQRFVLTAKVSILSKDVLPTNPPRILQKMDVTFFIGDVIDNRIYESCVVEVKGAGINENKAFISAFQSISPQNKVISAMLADAKESISEYYRNSYKTILRKADALAKSKEYDAALYELTSVPEVDTTITMACQNAIIAVYQYKLDDEAAQAALEREEKEYQRKLEREEKEYQRKIEQRDFEFARDKYNNEQAYRKDVLAACREVGKEYAKNQPKTITKNIIKLW